MPPGRRRYKKGGAKRQSKDAAWKPFAAQGKAALQKRRRQKAKQGCRAEARRYEDP
jgi:hypothetical protein